MTFTLAVRTVKNSDDGQKNSPKHVEFYSINKFEKLVHLVGFIIRIYHDKLSPERQILNLFVVLVVFLDTSLSHIQSHLLASLWSGSYVQLLVL